MFDFLNINKLNKTFMCIGGYDKSLCFKLWQKFANSLFLCKVPGKKRNNFPKKKSKGE